MKEKRVEVYRFKRKKAPNSRNKNPHFKQVTSVTWQADLTSTMIVAIKRVGSNIRFSCFIGPMRKAVLRSKHRQAIQTRTNHTGDTEVPPHRLLQLTCGNEGRNSSQHLKGSVPGAMSGPLCLILIQPTDNVWGDHRTVTVLVLQMKKLKSRSTYYLPKPSN